MPSPIQTNFTFGFAASTSRATAIDIVVPLELEETSDRGERDFVIGQAPALGERRRASAAG